VPDAWYEYGIRVDPLTQTVALFAEREATGQAWAVHDMPADVAAFEVVRIDDADYCTGTTSFFDEVTYDDEPTLLPG
jgi:hypothetical protein